MGCNGSETFLASLFTVAHSVYLRFASVHKLHALHAQLSALLP